MSNAVTTSAFRDQPFSPKTGQPAGEAGSTAWNYPPSTCPSAATTTNTFYAEVDFKSATEAPQPGLTIGISASVQQSPVRMTLLNLIDTGSGITLRFFDVIDDGAGYLFQSTDIAVDLSYTDIHNIDMKITFVDGRANDIVEIFLDGVLIHTGTTWEVYYEKVPAEQIVGGTPPRLQGVDSLLFRASGTAAPATSGTYIHLF